MVRVCFRNGMTIKVVWSVMRGFTDIKEDLVHVDKLSVYLENADEILQLDPSLYSIVNEDLVISVSDIRPYLKPNFYSLRAIWYRTGSDVENIAEVRQAFSITNYQDEGTYYKGSSIIIRVKSPIASFAPNEDVPDPEPVDSKLYYIDCNEWVDGSLLPNPVPRNGVYLCREYNDATNQWETHDVWHLGCKWRCLQHQPVENLGRRIYNEPKWNSSYWQFLEGNDIVTARIISTGGTNFRIGQVSTTLIGKAFFGYTDITDDVPQVNFNWSRRTEAGQSADDITWTAHHQGFKNIQLTNNDMPIDWSWSNRAIFTLTVTVDDGRETIELEDTISFAL